MSAQIASPPIPKSIVGIGTTILPKRENYNHIDEPGILIPESLVKNGNIIHGRSITRLPSCHCPPLQDSSIQMLNIWHDETDIQSILPVSVEVVKPSGTPPILIPPIEPTQTQTSTPSKPYLPVSPAPHVLAVEAPVTKVEPIVEKKFSSSDTYVSKPYKNDTITERDIINRPHEYISRVSSTHSANVFHSERVKHYNVGADVTGYGKAAAVARADRDRNLVIMTKLKRDGFW
jgi:hypothetical protein